MSVGTIICLAIIGFIAFLMLGASLVLLILLGINVAQIRAILNDYAEGPLMPSLDKADGGLIDLPASKSEPPLD